MMTSVMSNMTNTDGNPTAAAGTISAVSLNQRRWDSFKNNSRAYYSLWVFISLFLISMCSEFIANDKPLVVKFDDNYYFPVLFTYVETEFGGRFPTQTEYKDPYIVELIEKADGWMLWPMVRFTNNSLDMFIHDAAPAPPTRDHILGTDDSSQDVFAKAIYGFRLSIIFGICLTVCGSIIGIAAGAIQGYFGGWVDLIFQRLIEIWAGMPILFLLIILSSLVEPNPYWLFGLLLLFSWMALVGLSRAEFLRARNFEYVKAARALGVSNARIMIKHILPNATVAVLTMIPFILVGSITLLTSLDFIGFGLPDDYPSLGRLMRQGKNNLQAPWLGLTAFFTLSIMLTLLIFIGEGIRDAMDPRKY
jgi:microcin C transport system permease protein